MAKSKPRKKKGDLKSRISVRNTRDNRAVISNIVLVTNIANPNTFKLFDANVGKRVIRYNKHTSSNLFNLPIKWTVYSVLCFIQDDGTKYIKPYEILFHDQVALHNEFAAINKITSNAFAKDFNPKDFTSLVNVYVPTGVYSEAQLAELAETVDGFNPLYKYCFALDEGELDVSRMSETYVRHHVSGREVSIKEYYQLEELRKYT